MPKDKRRVRLFRAAGAGRRPIVAALDLKTDRQKRQTADAEMDLGRRRLQKGARKELKRGIEEELGRFEKFQLGD